MMAAVLNQQHLALLTRNSDEAITTKLLKRFSAYHLSAPLVMKQYHDRLLFHAAFPASRQVHELVQQELQRVSSAVTAMQGSKKKMHALAGTGISGSELICNWSRPIAEWLVNSFPGHVALNDAEASPETVREIFQLLLPPVEYEKISQRELHLGARIKFLTGIADPREQLHWLLEQFAFSELSSTVKDHLYLQLKIFLRWKLNDDFFSKTFLRIPVKEIFFPPGGSIIKRHGGRNDLKRKKSGVKERLIPAPDAQKIIHQKIARPVRLSLRERKNILDVMKASLAFECRETDPVTYADAKETELFDVGHGIRIGLVGMNKEKRLSLESYVGYMAFKNGIPVSYGGGWIWGQRCKIGVNIYPAFRGAESSFLFCQVLRLYHQYFKVKKFIVKPYQFGKGNREGLASGAFWFYYKLGFRPVDKKINMFAEKIWGKISLDRHRVPVEEMKIFTSCNLELDLAKKIVPGYDAATLSSAITKMINRDFRSSREMAVKVLQPELKKIFPPKKRKAPLNDLTDWILVRGLLKDFSKWKQLEKQKFIRLISLKQSGREREYIKNLQQNSRLWDSLLDSCH
jgi:hypothetical protein